MTWTAEQKRARRGEDAANAGRSYRPQIRRGNSPPPAPPPQSDPETRSTAEQNEALRMENEDLQTRLMRVAEKVDKMGLDAIRRRLRPGDKVCIKREFARPLGLSIKDARTSYKLVAKGPDGNWMLEVTRGAHKGRLLFANLPETALDI